MAQKSNENKPGQDAGRVPEGYSQGSEFENAVTTEISGVLASAFGEHQATEPNDVHVTDAQLAAYADPAADDALPPASRLGDRFEIVDIVHAGGMSLVYKAVDHGRRSKGSRETQVAIKMMRPSIASDDEARHSLEAEAATAQSVSHPNVVDVIELAEHEGRYFLVMEWLQGESVNALLRRMRGVRLEPGVAWRVVAGLANAVQHVHQKSVVHADINPSNIFVTETQRIKLLDFGVARFAGNSEAPEDDRFAWVTKPYASPEVLSGLPPVYEDDVFSVACVAYRLLAGKHPFGGRLSLVAKHQGRSVEPVPGLPQDEWQVLEKALAYERSDRPGTVSDFVDLGSRNAVRKQRTERRTTSFTTLQLASMGVAAAAVLFGSLWFLQRDGDVEISPQTDSPLPQRTQASEATGAPTVSPVESLLTAAGQALADGQLVTPEEGNARALFRQVLEIAPDNAAALRGLRTISNEFVQRARLALSADDPQRAYVALSVAAETDPSNAAIEIVDELLTARAAGDLADARLALAAGSLELAASRLAAAERYTTVDAAEIQAIRQQIEQARQSELVLQNLAVVDAHISAGRLLSPEADNAHARLLELRAVHGDDTRVLASMERLGERLLTRAAFAAAADRVADANELLDAVEMLGVLAPEVDAARAALSVVDTAPVAEDAAVSQLADERAEIPPVASDTQVPLAAEDSTELAPAVQEPQPLVEQSPDVAAAALESLPAATQQSGDTLLTASAAEQALPESSGSQSAGANAALDAPISETVDSAPAGTTAAATPRRQSLQELGITQYVAPRFPGFAERRGLSGLVEVEFVINADGSTEAVEVIHSEPGGVFVKSATSAVREWRFEPRDAALRAQVTLRFDYEP